MIHRDTLLKKSKYTCFLQDADGLLPMVSVMWVVSVADLGGDLQSHHFLEGLRILLSPASVPVSVHTSIRKEVRSTPYIRK